MKEYYQPRGGKKGKFALRENTYRRTWYLIADYPYFKAVQRGQADAQEFTQANSSGIAEKMFEYNLQAEQCERYIKAIEAAQEKVPEQYVENIMNHIISRRQYKDMENVSERTIKIWVQRFIWHVAHNLGDA